MLIICMKCENFLAQKFPLQPTIPLQYPSTFYLSICDKSAHKQFEWFSQFAEKAIRLYMCIGYDISVNRYSDMKRKKN